MVALDTVRDRAGELVRDVSKLENRKYFLEIVPPSLPPTDLQSFRAASQGDKIVPVKVISRYKSLNRISHLDTDKFIWKFIHHLHLVCKG